jgi:hypothetical protein
MIKELQEKIFKQNVDRNPLEASIVMRKREVAMNQNKMFTTKFVENQMFDSEGNMLITQGSNPEAFLSEPGHFHQV